MTGDRKVMVGVIMLDLGTMLTLLIDEFVVSGTLCIGGDILLLRGVMMFRCSFKKLILYQKLFFIDSPEACLLQGCSCFSSSPTT